MEIDNDNSSQASSSTEYDNVLLTNDPYKYETFFNNVNTKYKFAITHAGYEAIFKKCIENFDGHLMLVETKKCASNRCHLNDNINYFGECPFKYRIYFYETNELGPVIRNVADISVGSLVESVYQGQFHLMFIAISSHETESDFTKLYKLYELIGYEFKP
ncbi:unnamed protein product [Brachionus calyciflorus]|uniref:Uncharacterized protein n=1 Tax=Brachionus calyciflorus TaxID=104777 RepID=A0A813X9X4_9BILA|nr:unnamed protein product [Brachionus calyciflorus]